MKTKKISIILFFVFYALLKSTQWWIVKPYLIYERQQWLYTEAFLQSNKPPEDNRGPWTGLPYLDNDWNKGRAPIGYDFKNLKAQALFKTILSYKQGGRVYLRRKFSVPFPGIYAFSPLTLRVASDNGAEVYLNGKVVDSDIPSFDTPELRKGHEYEYWNRTVEVDSKLLKEGQNIVAVLLDNDRHSTDCFFELTLETFWAPFWNKWGTFTDIAAGLLFVIVALFIGKNVFIIKRLKVHIKQQDDDKISRLVEKLHVKKSSEPKILVILVDYYAKKGDTDNLVEVALQNARVQNNSPESLEILARAYKKAEKYEAAIEVLRRIFQHVNTSAAVDNNAKKILSEVYISAGQLDKAEAVLQQVLKEIALGDFFVQRGMIKKEDLALALKEGKGKDELLEQTLLRKGLITKEDMAEALRRKTDTNIMEQLAEIKTMRKDKEGAANIYKTMLSIEPENYSAIFKMSKAKYDDNKIAEAIPGFQKVSQSESEYKESAYYYLTLCFLKHDQVNMAIKYLDILDVNLLSKDKLYALAKLLEDNKQDRRAFNLYTIIFQQDIKFRDVEQKVLKMDALLSEAGTEEPSIDSYTNDIKGFTEKTGNRYTDFEVIGQGGMGMVYKATDKKLNRTVAVKMTSRILHESPQNVGRFLREAQAVAMLNHPNIISIYDIVTEKIPFMVMEYFDGWDLGKEISKEAKLDEKKILKIAKQFVSALSYAHKKGIIHRDIKPENIMINDEGELKITDFGLAKCLDLTALTVSGFYGGTKAYMAPEQEKTGVTDKYSDIYSFGIVFLELFIGRIAQQQVSKDNLKEFVKENPDMKNEDFGHPAC
jgi:tetratricopeptide (TPR) repeat protein/tRNA A-37 threonylcarbamoyl transferase component Bud32